MLTILKQIVTQRKNVLYFVIAFIVFTLVLLILPSFHVVQGIIRIFPLSDGALYTSLVQTLLMNLYVMNLLERFIFFLFALSLSLNTVLLIAYVKNYRNQIKQSGTTLSFLGVILGMFGIGCLSCGVLLLAPLVSIIGISTTQILLSHSLLLSIIGIALVLFSSYLLILRMNKAYVCKVKNS